MHPNFEKAFEASKKKDYLSAKAIYQDLFLDIRTYSDYFLLKEILFLLDIRILLSNLDQNEIDLPDSKQLANNLKCMVVEGEACKEYQNKDDFNQYESMYVIQKKNLFHHASYIGLNYSTNSFSFFYYKDKYKIKIENMTLDQIDICEYNEAIYFYQLGSNLSLVVDRPANKQLQSYFSLFQDIFKEYHLSHVSNLINYDQVHEWFTLLDNNVGVDLTRIETQDFGDFTFDENNQKEIIRYLKLIDPIMWISDYNLEKVPVQDFQFDLIGNRWCNHRIFLELLAVIKTLPCLEFGKTGFINKKSLYLPYEQNYYICRNITRLENDREYE